MIVLFFVSTRRKWFTPIEKKFQTKKKKNKGQTLSLWDAITPGKGKVKASMAQFIIWANGIILAGTTSGK